MWLHFLGWEGFLGVLRVRGRGTQLLYFSNWPELCCVIYFWGAEVRFDFSISPPFFPSVFAIFFLP